MKKLISIIVAVAMLIMTTPIAFAAESDYAATTSEITLETQGADRISLRYEDFENGDVSFSMVKNGKITYTAYVERISNQIIETDYQEDIPRTTRKIVTPVPRQMTLTPYASTFKYAGRVGYDHYAQGTYMATNHLDFSYASNIDYTAKMDPHGQYKNIAELAALIAAALLLPSVLATVVAKAVVSVFGFTVSAVNFTLGKAEVSAKKTTVKWRISLPNGSKVKTIEGSTYVCTLEGSEDLTDTVGNYFSTSSYDDHDEGLALAVYSDFYRGADRVEVVSWT